MRHADLREGGLRAEGCARARGLGGRSREVRPDRAGRGIPSKFLENILLELRHAGVVQSQRGERGGYWLARPASEIPLAEVITAVEGPLANVRGTRPEAVEYVGAAHALRDVWIAARASLRGVLESVSLADVAAGSLPADIGRLVGDPEAWQPH